MNSNSAVRSDPRSNPFFEPNGMSRGLGWLGVGLGVTELAFPRTLASVVGVDQRNRASSMIVRALGVREIASGLAVLASPRHPAPLWARVIGDAIDLGLLGLAMTARGSNHRRLALSLGAIAGIAAADVIAAQHRMRARRGSPVIASVTINKPPLEVYEFFRRFDHLPQFMDYLTSVEQLGPRRSRWTAKLPIGGTVSWEAEILGDEPGSALWWCSVEDSPIQTRGRVTFTRTPGRNMTEVRVELQLGVLGRGTSTSLARLFAKPQVKADLQRLKQVMETGEVLRSDASHHQLLRPAQPAAYPAEAGKRSIAPKSFVRDPPTLPKRGKGVTP
jgi:uncharacterized membrane protein